MIFWTPRLSRPFPPSSLSSMRSLALCFLALATALVSRGADVAFTRVWPGWRDAEAFERISEFFNGRENTSGKIILRTQPAARDGYYFLVRLNNPNGALADAKFSLQIIAPDHPQPKTFAFPTAVAAGRSVFDLGVTGADWAGKKSQPVAWKLELQGADGHAIATAKSFLWEKPAK